MSLWQQLAGLLLGEPREADNTEADAVQEIPRRVFVVGPTGGTWLVVPHGEAEVIGPDDSVIGPGEEVIGPSTALTVEPPKRSVWDERGWHREVRGNQQVYTGPYRITDLARNEPLAYHGVIYVKRREIVPCIAEPPAAIKRHPKGVCFTKMEKPWYRLHWRRAAKNVDEAILYMERVLDEAVNRRRT